MKKDIVKMIFVVGLVFLSMYCIYQYVTNKKELQFHTGNELCFLLL